MEIDEEEDSVEEILGEARLIFVGDEEEYRMRVRGGGQQSPAKEAKEDRESRGGGGELELGCV